MGREQPEKELVDLNALMRNIEENLALRAGLTLHIQKHLPQILTERIPLQQIFSNLIDNAVKYHDKTAGHIKVYFRDQQIHYQFFVEDNGPGIAKNYHDKIFGIFQTLQEQAIL